MCNCQISFLEVSENSKLKGGVEEKSKLKVTLLILLIF